ncbi:hypothetical protein K474DRAFT_1666631 [Panus rudis PR-1116 ss-1]|nr:hypothetical protein K474DRAFT_1666631 [Panus rudis PR-1116 ss-1]
MPSLSVRKSTTISMSVPKGKKILRREHLRKYSWLPDVLRISGSIIPKVFGPVLTITLFSVATAYAWDHGYNVTLTNSVIPLFTVVVGMILVFRNGTSYDRYWEGRKDFGTMISHIRNFSRLVWVNVAVPPTDDASKSKYPSANLTAKQLRRKKVEALKLSLCFAYACKHYLRGEDGLDWADFAGIVPQSLVRLTQPSSRRTSVWASYAATERNSRNGSPGAESDHEEGENRDLNDHERNSTAGTGVSGSSTITEVRREGTDATKRVRVKRSKDNMKQPGVRSPNPNYKTPLLSNQLHKTIDFNSDPDSLTTPLPMVIAHQLSHLLFVFKRDGYLETVGPAGTNAMSQLVQGMIDMLTAMERVANTPIPRSYSIHLKQTVSLYLFSLPFTLVKELGWGMVPLVTVVAFTLMGIEGIADEIEMPFGLDKFDLPLERYCDDLKEEIEYMIERMPEGGEGMYGLDDGEGDD